MNSLSFVLVAREAKEPLAPRSHALATSFTDSVRGCTHCVRAARQALCSGQARLPLASVHRRRETERRGLDSAPGDGRTEVGIRAVSTAHAVRHSFASVSYILSRRS